MRIFYTEEAILDLKRLKEFLEKNNIFSVSKASQRIIKTTDLLKTNLLLGRNVRGKKEIRELIISFGKSNYLLRYKLEENKIYILRIWHAKEISAI